MADVGSPTRWSDGVLTPERAQAAFLICYNRLRRLYASGGDYDLFIGLPRNERFRTGFFTGMDTLARAALSRIDPVIPIYLETVQAAQVLLERPPPSLNIGQARLGFNPIEVMRRECFPQTSKRFRKTVYGRGLDPTPDLER